MPFCTNCGGSNSGDAQFCVTCGSVLDPSAIIDPSKTVLHSGTSANAGNKAIIAMILGILSIAASCGPFTGIAAIILASQELRAIREGRASAAGKSLSQIGLWTGWIGTVLCSLAWIAYATFFVFLAGVLGG